MQPEELNVFDFDGTLIRVNSFREISKKVLTKLLKKFRFGYSLAIIVWFVLRKCGIISHFVFKQHIVSIFEKSLTEPEKRDICQSVFDDNINKHVFDRMANFDNCIICTAAPFSYISRICLGRDVPVICALDPTNSSLDATNLGAAKVANLKRYFDGKNIRVANFFTDERTEDQPLIDLATNAFVVESDRVTKVK
ncbi:MAG: haloacid dehalogenase-like hydrolase [Phycisphaerae bacterium]|jgi:hypothetical protein